MTIDDYAPSRNASGVVWTSQVPAAGQHTVTITAPQKDAEQRQQHRRRSRRHQLTGRPASVPNQRCGGLCRSGNRFGHNGRRMRCFRQPDGLAACGSS
ncbi:MAG TPA: hypothetical protein VJ914_06395 [Pseudonocardiaceae bacterium]|nr:hypothetical protein [Pseudonocardiaceae bacterium]